MSLQAGDSNRAQPSRPNVRQGGEQVGNDDMHLPRNEIDQREVAPLVGYVRHVYAGDVLEELPGEMTGAADAARSEVELARSRLRERDEFLHVVHGQRRMDDDEKGRGAHLRD